MQKKVYAKEKANAYAQRARGDNRIELSPSEKLWLRDALEDQLTACKISGLSRELTQIIYRQTIGFNKKVDDISGKCLYKLLGEKSRYDYCLKTMRSLIEQNILITRKGHYGQIFAINYNFEQWQQTLPDDVELISDPEGFVQANFEPEKYPEAPEETWESEATWKPEKPEETDNPEKTGDSVSKASALQNADKTNAQESGHRSDAAHGNKNVIAYALTDCNFGSASNEADFGQNQALAETKNRLQTAEIIAFQHTTAESNLPEQTVPEPKPEPITAESKPEPITAESKPEPITPESKPEPITAESKPLEPITSESKPAKQKALIFPKELKPHEKTAVEKVLEKEALDDRTIIQKLLDTLSSRFKISDWEPIRSPIAYFRSLIHSIKQGTFEDTYAEIYQQKRQETAEVQQTQQKNGLEQEQRNKQQEARNCYESTKLHAGILQCSLREVAKKRGWENLLDEMGFDLDIAT